MALLQFLKKPGGWDGILIPLFSSSNANGLFPGRRSICDPINAPENVLDRLHCIEGECLQATGACVESMALEIVRGLLIVYYYLLSDSLELPRTTSRLFCHLRDILGDQNCLCYFLQFMEAEEAVPLIKFWLAVENFRLSAQQTTMTEATMTTTTTTVDSNSNKCDIEDRPLTDDEKSEIISQQEQKKEKSRPRKTTKRNSQFQTTVATDALKIIEMFLCANSDSWIDVPPMVSSRISLSMCHCDERTSLVSPDCFAEAQQFVEERLEREYLRRFLDSEFYSKYCLEILTGGDLQLPDILYSECALFYFMEFLEQEQQRDYLDFWMSATNFRNHSAGASGDAMVLYDKYFSLQATNPLKLSDVVRSRVEERICSAEAILLVGCFDLPLRIVERLFGEFYLERFLVSDLFFKHVSDLASRAQQQQQQRHPRVLRTQSLTGEGEKKKGLRRVNSTVSIAEKETTTTVAKLGSTVELRIDASQLGSGDFWSAGVNSSSSLSFGRVNALGRFERDFEWGDEGGEGAGGEESAGSRLKKAVKRLVNLSEDKVQEELAWQVAEMIVKDVTDVTMNGRGAMAGVRNGGVNMVVEDVE